METGKGLAEDMEITPISRIWGTGVTATRVDMISLTTIAEIMAINLLMVTKKIPVHTP